MLKPEFTGKFKRDYKAALKRGLKPSELETVVTILCREEPLPTQYRDYSLKVTSKNHSASDAQSDFSSDCIEISQLLQSKNLHTCRISRNLCAG